VGGKQRCCMSFENPEPLTMNRLHYPQFNS